MSLLIKIFKLVISPGGTQIICSVCASKFNVNRVYKFSLIQNMKYNIRNMKLDCLRKFRRKGVIFIGSGSFINRKKGSNSESRFLVIITVRKCPTKIEVEKNRWPLPNVHLNESKKLNKKVKNAPFYFSFIEVIIGAYVDFFSP